MECRGLSRFRAATPSAPRAQDASLRLALRDQPLPYRLAMPVILTLSLCLWAVAWQVGAYLIARLFD